MPTLVLLMNWLESDGLLRTEEDVQDEALHELGFTRHGPRIDAALSQALQDDCREVMVQVWYPAADDPTVKRAPYVDDARTLTPSPG